MKPRLDGRSVAGPVEGNTKRSAIRFFGDVIMQMHKPVHLELHRRSPAPHWRSRLVAIGVIAIVLAMYVAGIFWFGRGLADDVRAGAREVPAGSIVYDRER